MTSVSLDRIASALGMTESKTPDTHIWATVSSINEDGSYQVQFNGAGTTTRAAKVCNAEVGDRVLCVVSNGQVSAIGRVGGYGIAVELIWTNEGQTSSFPAQTITINSDKPLSDYDFVMVLAKRESGYSYISSHIFKIGDTGTIQSPQHDASLLPTFRNVTVNNNNTISFGVGFFSGQQTANTYSIPMKIYGIKGVN